MCRTIAIDITLRRMVGWKPSSRRPCREGHKLGLSGTEILAHGAEDKQRFLQGLLPSWEIRDQECTAFPSTCCTTTLMALGTAGLPGDPQTSTWHLQDKRKRVKKGTTRPDRETGQSGPAFIITTMDTQGPAQRKQALHGAKLKLPPPR